MSGKAWEDFIKTLEVEAEKCSAPPPTPAPATQVVHTIERVKVAPIPDPMHGPAKPWGSGEP